MQTSLQTVHLQLKESEKKMKPKKAISYEEIKKQAKQDFEKDMSILAKMNEIILKAVYEWYQKNNDDKIRMANGDNIAKLRCNRLITLERFFLNELCYAEDASQMIKQIELLGCGEWQQIDEDILCKWRNGIYSAMVSLDLDMGVI